MFFKNIIFLMLVSGLVTPAIAKMAHQQAPSFDRSTALSVSQGVIGHSVGDYVFQATSGEYINLSSYRGKPLVVSLIYTSCYHICPTTTRHLAEVIDKARQALGNDSFNVLSIGFDVFRDTPPMMRHFARQQDIDLDQWRFLSADSTIIDDLARDLGFIFYPSANGFDHLIQTTILDGEGKVYRQIYGMDFGVPALIDPLKRLVFNSADLGVVDAISNKIRLFCTVYDPAQDKYRFDYSVIIGTVIGFLCAIVFGLQLIKEWRLTLRS